MRLNWHFTLNIDAISSSTASSFRAFQSVSGFGTGETVVVVPAVVVSATTAVSVRRITPAHGEERLRGSAGALPTHFAVLPTLAATAAAVPLRHGPRLGIDAAIVLNGAEAEASPFVDARTAVKTRSEAGLALTVVTPL